MTIFICFDDDVLIILFELTGKKVIETDMYRNAIIVGANL